MKQDFFGKLGAWCQQGGRKIILVYDDGLGALAMAAAYLGTFGRKICIRHASVVLFSSCIA
jgi:hypothetical protein